MRITALIMALTQSNLPAWLCTIVLLTAAITMVITACARAKAKIVRAQGESKYTVANYESGLRFRRWRLQRRERCFGHCSRHRR
ncbi:hypothetical protein ACFXHA_43505 [Nocardia sp. NPDC059240]|uniref:hypothetical protein n=1 Tax=Nocardia sp. NPDC059240 TaxID=3346786 RepID=UPI0036B19F32